MDSDFYTEGAECAGFNINNYKTQTSTEEENKILIFE